MESPLHIDYESRETKNENSIQPCKERKWTKIVWINFNLQRKCIVCKYICSKLAKEKKGKWKRILLVRSKLSISNIILVKRTPLYTEFVRFVLQWRLIQSTRHSRIFNCVWRKQPIRRRWFEQGRSRSICPPIDTIDSSLPPHSSIRTSSFSDCSTVHWLIRRDLEETVRGNGM